MQQIEQKELLATLQQSFNDVVSKTGLKSRDVCHQLLKGNIKNVDVPDFAACEVGPRWPDNFVKVTLDKPIADAGALRAYKYRNPNNAALVDENNNWTGVVAYFREWQGFIESAVKQLNVLRVHESNT